nr:synaptotagmin-5-like isoform X1 [Ipomoea trifida]
MYVLETTGGSSRRSQVRCSVGDGLEAAVDVATVILEQRKKLKAVGVIGSTMDAIDGALVPEEERLPARWSTLLEKDPTKLLPSSEEKMTALPYVTLVEGAKLVKEMA